LTIPSDKLPAVFGIAHSFQRGVKKQKIFIGEYLAGVWRGELIINFFGL
jgi:hypothetical protein